MREMAAAHRLTMQLDRQGCPGRQLGRRAGLPGGVSDQPPECRQLSWGDNSVWQPESRSHRRRILTRPDLPTPAPNALISAATQAAAMGQTVSTMSVVVLPPASDVTVSDPL